MRRMKKVRSVLAVTLSLLFTAWWGFVGMVVSLVSTRHVIKCSVRPWGRTVLWSCGVRLKLVGKENFPDTPVIVMCNHQSSLDIPVFFRGGSV